VRELYLESLQGHGEGRASFRGMSKVHFPGESAQYRRAREELLKAETELRRHSEAVANLRRKLPLGGAVPEDYVFEGAAASDHAGPGKKVKLSELFEGKKTTLVLYNFMFGPAMKQPCPMCSSMLDGLNANARAIVERVNLAVVARSPIARILEFTKARGWNNLRILSSANNDFNRAYHGEKEDGSQNPIMHVFVKRDGVVHHFWSSELAFADFDDKFDPRHVDLMWPLWNTLDLTPEGRGDFYPKLAN
jgi:predicted dithiol-disulfide oxidoreductase (DUF899 family)